MEAPQHRPRRHEGVQQQAKQDPRRCSATSGGTVENAMVVVEPPLPTEPGDPKDAGHRAPARRQDRSDQQNLGMPPTPLLEERREAEGPAAKRPTDAAWPLSFGRDAPA